MPVRLPAETEPHEGTLMAWPARVDLWGDLLAEAEAVHAEVAVAIARFEPVTMVARREHAERAATACGGQVEVVALPIDDSWARDSGPTYVLDDEGLLAVDWTFNAWGGKYQPYGDDDRLPQRWCEWRGERRVRADLVLEGGSIAADGEGTVLTTEQCLLHPNRNPHRTRAEIEAQLAERIGAHQVVWMPWGLADDDETDGHVDNVALFARPGAVVLQGCDDVNEPDHDRLEVDRRCLEGALDAAGRPIDVEVVPVLPFAEVGGARHAVPYLNAYACNGGLIVPVTGHPADTDVLAQLGALLPGREVVPVPGAVLAHGGGGPHCITQQIPQVPQGPHVPLASEAAG
jgi:agmatine deiminase